MKKDSEALKAEVKKLLALDKLPNGDKVSRIRIARYLFGKGYYYENSGRKLEYTERGIDKVVDKIMQQGNKRQPVDILSREEFNILSEPFEFEDGIDESIPDHIIEGGNYTALVINDVHIPYHHIDALKLAINTGREERVNKVILNGDIFDFYAVSRWDKRPDRTLLREELESGKRFMHQLRKIFPSEEIIFKVGNHEDRMQQYIAKNAPALYGMDCITIPELLDMRTLGVKYVGSSQLIQMGHLTILHGHEIINSGAVVNVSRTKRLKAQDNIMFGHHHRTQSDFATSIKGKTHGSYAVGCLCNMRPAYFPMAYQEWNHGFALVKVHADGTFQVRNHKILNGSVY